MISIIFENKNNNIKYWPAIPVLAGGLGLAAYYRNQNKIPENNNSQISNNISKNNINNQIPKIPENNNLVIPKIPENKSIDYNSLEYRQNAYNKDFETFKKLYGYTDDQANAELDFYIKNPDFVNKLTNNTNDYIRHQRIIDDNWVDFFKSRNHSRSVLPQKPPLSREEIEDLNNKSQLSPMEYDNYLKAWNDYEAWNKKIELPQIKRPQLAPYRLYSDDNITPETIQRAQQIRDSGDIMMTDLYPTEVLALARKREEVKTFADNDFLNHQTSEMDALEGDG